MKQKANKSLFNCVAISMICGLTSTTFANENPLKAQMTVYQIVDQPKHLKKELKQTDQVKPESLLEYQVSYLNTSANSLKSLKLNLPIPSHVNYTGTSVPKNTYASIDGQNFAKAPLTRVVNGKKVLVPFNEYRVLQWQVDELKPKQTISVAAQVRVNAN
ncbi:MULTISPECIES: hypothetical protein [Acinetobacter]|jgi:hypothetical protein|uniref:DUF11 domain-containing protein n=1 Tax=Acinetobacter chengduensis TaxID=2420890 RepID=A0ABX9TX28_9GAMM|nr:MULTISPECIES: hypothetical protein [Acinetobacter]RKG40256.1 hypothetical protein D7V31_12915 [Acinetobacter sp. WCHAc060007]RLL21733.1 hypothetical protein D9K81_08515 [Acinetobacter chengduensis]